MHMQKTFNVFVNSYCVLEQRRINFSKKTWNDIKNGKLPQIMHIQHVDQSICSTFFVRSMHLWGPKTFSWVLLWWNSFCNLRKNTQDKFHYFLWGINYTLNTLSDLANENQHNWRQNLSFPDSSVTGSTEHWSKSVYSSEFTVTISIWSGSGRKIKNFLVFLWQNLGIFNAEKDCNSSDTYLLKAEIEMKKSKNDKFWRQLLHNFQTRFFPHCIQFLTSQNVPTTWGECNSCELLSCWCLPRAPEGSKPCTHTATHTHTQTHTYSSCTPIWPRSTSLLPLVISL